MPDAAYFSRALSQATQFASRKHDVRTLAARSCVSRLIATLASSSDQRELRVGMALSRLPGDRVAKAEPAHGSLPEAASRRRRRPDCPAWLPPLRSADCAPSWPYGCISGNNMWCTRPASGSCIALLHAGLFYLPTHWQGCDGLRRVPLPSRVRAPRRSGCPGLVPV